MGAFSRYCRVTAIALIVVLINGCAAKGAHQQVIPFAEAVSLTTSNVQSAFDTVEREHAQAQADALVADNAANFNPKAITSFLSPADVTARLAVLNSLTTYAESLAQVSGPLKGFDEATVKLGESFKSLSMNALIQQQFGAASEQQRNIAITAVNAIGSWLVERKRQKVLPELIAEMQPHVQAVCDLLVADFGDPTHGGLRNQLWNSYTQRMIAQSAYIQHNLSTFDPVTRSAEIRKLPDLVRGQKHADEVLARTQKSVARIGSAHSELVKAVTDKADFKVRISALIQEGQRIKSFYDVLNAGE